MEESDKVFVHCFAGVSRSATLVIAYFMWKNKKPYKEVYEFVNKRRSIGPNYGFRKQLLIFEFIKKNKLIGPNLGFRKQLLLFEQQLKENNYNLDKIDFKSIEWPPKEGINYDFNEL